MSEPRRHFHDELKDLQATLLRMSSEAEAAVSLAVEALLARDRTKAEEVIAGDWDIDRLEMGIENQCVNLLALHQPMARDLRMLTAILKISNDLERVGDHAVNIAESTMRLAGSRMMVAVPELVEMARLTKAMLADALEAFVRQDPEAAREICSRDDQVDTLHRSVFRIVLGHMMKDPELISAGMEFTSTSRNLERIADLATNISEDVVFLVEGKTIKHHAEEHPGVDPEGKGGLIA
ncbi:MAG: phosphate signaling complex protein PhoU [Gemmatimonadales bacterium]|nr:MAG: phosphate signaling complex protein PhoU [Gemmatimonadales bacterium]